MSPSIWETFLALFSSDGETDEASDERRFVPSPLDLSVRVGHGGSDSERVRELSELHENARELEERRRDT